MTRIDVQARAVRGARTRPVWRPPSRLGGWDLVERVSQGGLTCVYRARPAEGGSSRPASYAVKVLRPEWEHDAQAIEMLTREALVGRRVTHPHLISVLAACVRQSPRYLVMPWLEGRTLTARLQECLPPDVPEILWVVRQVAEALAALHEHGWMHGDVKPENVMVSPAGHATLLDLGFARRRNEDASAATRILVGTFAYMAPELLSSRLRADIRSDLYSLGVVLFEALGGRLPFTGRSMPELISQHQRAPAPDLKRLVPQVPDEVAELVRRLLAKEPLRRPQNPAELVEQLVELEIATFSERALA